MKNIFRKLNMLLAEIFSVSKIIKKKMENV